MPNPSLSPSSEPISMTSSLFALECRLRRSRDDSRVLSRERDRRFRLGVRDLDLSRAFLRLCFLFSRSRERSRDREGVCDRSRDDLDLERSRER